jgi:glutamate-5-semialdehyde dehydrogenase
MNALDVTTDDLEATMLVLGRRARAAAATLAFADPALKVEALHAAADAIDDRRDDIMSANALDMRAAEGKGISKAFLDRLLLTDKRIDAMIEGLRVIADLADPVGRVLAEWTRPNGMQIRRVATPLGVIGVIFESRPNVTADAGALTLKAGNAVILRGGSDSVNSTRAIHACLVAG